MNQLSLFPPEGVTVETLKRNRAMDDMEDRRHLELERLRKAARHCGYKNASGKKYGVPHGVTADDVREHLGLGTCTRDHQDPLASANNIMGSVFRPKYFVFSGQVYNSKTEGSHGNLLKIWIFDVQAWQQPKLAAEGAPDSG